VPSLAAVDIRISPVLTAPQGEDAAATSLDLSGAPEGFRASIVA